MPYVPPPAYVPPAVVPPAAASPSTTATPAPAPATDVAYVACTRASNGFGVNDIASELEEVYGVSGADAVNIAKQALTAVLGGGHYCDGYRHD
ncbi:hypothetical protein [Mycolicibacterium brisbanense]|uniref:hypothetical protein n=1 Tax=Mycolicibacterium brisbanense TaxID=146020 RepID=UPI0013F4F979|nr:hypothetical protein [Mycolicibacterium brisbanense]MCV7157348.1 hypothetical protein [Mycolicibacterium brisbanense]